MQRARSLRRFRGTRARRRPYHLVDDDAAVFEYELPEWLVGGD